MTDVENPKMAGSGNAELGESGDLKDKENSGGGNIKKHKRAHSRNKSITGRQDFIEEIANSEFRQETIGSSDGDGALSDNEDLVENSIEKDRLLPDGQDLPDGSGKINNTTNGVHPDRDETDALPPGLRYNCFDFSCTFISIVTYILDLVMDCIVAYYFYHLAVQHGIYHYWYFSLTLVFIVLPSLTMTGFSFRWYLMDSDNSQLPKVISKLLLVAMSMTVPCIPGFHDTVAAEAGGVGVTAGAYPQIPGQHEVRDQEPGGCQAGGEGQD